MRNKIFIAAVLFPFLFTISCQKESVSLSDPGSSPISSFQTDDMYTETAPMVQTPITKTIDPNIGGYLEALPAHYKDHPKKNYPLIIFLHGQGELGSGSTSDLNKVTDNAIPKLIANKTFPSNFIVHDTTFQFIVISPQFKAWPQTTDIDAMLKYAGRKYRVDFSRVYLCGLSMGGGGVWDVSWVNGKRFTAIVPIAGASWPTSEKGEYIAGDTVAVWAFHNNNDPTVPSWYSVDYVQYINDYNPVIRAKLTEFNSASHDAWTTATDPNYTENGENIYEWMLSYKKKR